MKLLSNKISLVVAYAFFALLASGCASSGGVDYNDSMHNDKNQSIKDVKPEVVTQKHKTMDYHTIVISNIDGKDISLTSINFSYDKFKLSDEAREIIKNNNEKINPVISSNSHVKIKLEGNCDEWGTDEYNYALGLKRAKVVKDALINDGISASKISLVSFGESNPVCKDRTQLCWKKNRRTDYKLLP
ncbi:Outer membrane lipoprotein omp16 precursor [hydrothermal vent metagenome]|uniref:Outer membrane lipoprotein omp16 n=1 Tax=hydrothermal vent metagenome TaxID=652676 RepID=A0A3B1E6S0_9ZZZZ